MLTPVLKRPIELRQVLKRRVTTAGSQSSSFALLQST